MFDWLKRKSGEHQVRNARYGLAKLLAAAHALEAAQASKRDPTPQEVASFQKAEKDFSLDVVGPLPLQEIKREVVDPALSDPGVSRSARVAVTHAFQYILDGPKYVQALKKVALNLFEAATEPARPDHAPLVLRFERPDSKLRYMAFCLATTYYFAVEQDTLVTLDKALREVWEDIGGFAVTDEGAAFFTGPVNRPESVQAGGAEIARTIEDWKAYALHFAERSAAGQALEGDHITARMVSRMLRRMESASPLTDQDARRLAPLAGWIEKTTAVIGSSVAQLAR